MKASYPTACSLPNDSKNPFFVASPRIAGKVHMSNLSHEPFWNIFGKEKYLVFISVFVSV